MQEYRDRLAAEKREAVLRGAYRVFLEQGYERASIERIAREASVSTRTIHKHFENKETLFEAMIHEMWEETSRLKENELSRGEPAEALGVIGREYAELMLKEETRAFYRVIIAESARSPELGRALLKRERSVYPAALRRYMGTRAGAENSRHPKRMRPSTVSSP